MSTTDPKTSLHHHTRYLNHFSTDSTYEYTIWTVLEYPPNDGNINCSFSTTLQKLTPLDQIYFFDCIRQFLSSSGNRSFLRQSSWNLSNFNSTVLPSFQHQQLIPKYNSTFEPRREYNGSIEVLNYMFQQPSAQGIIRLLSTEYAHQRMHIAKHSRMGDLTIRRWSYHTWGIQRIVWVLIRKSFAESISSGYLSAQYSYDYQEEVMSTPDPRSKLTIYLLPSFLRLKE